LFEDPTGLHTCFNSNGCTTTGTLPNLALFEHVANPNPNALPYSLININSGGDSLPRTNCCTFDENSTCYYQISDDPLPKLDLL
jgi:hypothetical protein